MTEVSEVDPVPPLSELTTLRVGGPARRVLAPATEQDLVAAALAVWDSGEDWLLVGGGSNTLASDEGFDGTVIRLVTRGIEQLPAPQLATDGHVVRLRVQAGEPWDDLVSYTVGRGWAGVEALSGIPGRAGAAPVQNIGAYGQELSSVLVAIDFLDFETGERSRLPASELALGYRTSELKQRQRVGIVIAIELDLLAVHSAEHLAKAAGTPLSQPIAYPQLAKALGVAVGDTVSLDDVRAAVLTLRASKGMVLDASDPDSVSAGSFFTNPIVTENFARSLPASAPRWPVQEASEEEMRRVIALADVASGATVRARAPHVDFRVKLSAAWLIENAGIARGFSLPGSRAAISSKHTLALINRGGATAAEVLELARYVQGRVQAEFGIILHPEPVLVGLTL